MSTYFVIKEWPYVLKCVFDFKDTSDKSLVLVIIQQFSLAMIMMKVLMVLLVPMMIRRKMIARMMVIMKTIMMTVVMMTTNRMRRSDNFSHEQFMEST